MFHRFFADKVSTVRASTAGALGPFSSTSAVMSAFHPVSTREVVDAIHRLPDKYCISDPIPTSFLKTVAEIIAPFLSELFS